MEHLPFFILVLASLFASSILSIKVRALIKNVNELETKYVTVSMRALDHIDSLLHNSTLKYKLQRHEVQGGGAVYSDP